MTETIHGAIRDAYETLAYVGRPFHETHPNRLLAVAHVHGVPLPKRETLSVLEIGSGDGANLLPMAAAYPRGRFVGVDLSKRLTASAREMADGLGLKNVSLFEADVREIPVRLGRFDVILAHGFYSWVPVDVRDALVHAIANHLLPDGVAYVNYNLLPGGWIRKVGWDAMQFHARGVADPAARVARAREFIEILVEGWRAQGGVAAAVAENFAREHERDDSGFFGDDIAPLNEPVYHSGFQRHVRKHRLVAFADLDPGARSYGTAGAALRERLAAYSPALRDQMLDFVHLRQMRQSLIAHAGANARLQRDPSRLRELHFAASAPYMRHRIAGGTAPHPAGDALAERFPASMPAGELLAAIGTRGERADATGAILAAWDAGIADPCVDPIRVVTRPSPRPRAFAAARWQAPRMPLVTNVRHVGVRLADDCARALVALCDGTKSIAELTDALRDRIPAAEAGQPQAAVERRLGQLASAALLEA